MSSQHTLRLNCAVYYAEQKYCRSNTTTENYFDPSLNSLFKLICIALFTIQFQCSFTENHDVIVYNILTPYSCILQIRAGQ